MIRQELRIFLPDRRLLVGVARSGHPGVVVDVDEAAGVVSIRARVAAGADDASGFLALALGDRFQTAGTTGFEYSRLRLKLLPALANVAGRVAGRVIFSIDHTWLDGPWEWAFPISVWGRF